MKCSIMVMKSGKVLSSLAFSHPPTTVILQDMRDGLFESRKVLRIFRRGPGYFKLARVILSIMITTLVFTYLSFVNNGTCNSRCALRNNDTINLIELIRYLP